jgi:hypothetical protein
MPEIEPTWHNYEFKHTAYINFSFEGDNPVFTECPMADVYGYPACLPMSTTRFILPCTVYYEFKDQTAQVGFASDNMARLMVSIEKMVECLRARGCIVDSIIQRKHMLHPYTSIRKLKDNPHYDRAMAHMQRM